MKESSTGFGVGGTSEEDGDFGCREGESGNIDGGGGAECRVTIESETEGGAMSVGGEMKDRNVDMSLR